MSKKHQKIHTEMHRYMTSQDGPFDRRATLQHFKRYFPKVTYADFSYIWRVIIERFNVH